MGESVISISVFNNQFRYFLIPLIHEVIFMEQKSNRRQFLGLAALTLAGIPLLKSHNAYAALKCPQGKPTDAKALKKLIDANGKTAKRLNFVNNAVDAKGHKKYTDGANCGNCKFYNKKKIVEDYSTCAMVANKYVPACGWCKSYKKA